jgi:hypothetical protein
MSLDFKGLAVSGWGRFWHLTCNSKHRRWLYLRRKAKRCVDAAGIAK